MSFIWPTSERSLTVTRADLDTFVKHVVRIAKAGVPPVVAGSMGEAHHLTNEERVTLVKAARAGLDAAGLTSVPIIAGTGLAGTRVTIELTREIAAAGADVAIVISSGYFVGALNKKAQKQLFIDVADASPIPIMVYNCTFLTPHSSPHLALTFRFAERPRCNWRPGP